MRNYKIGPILQTKFTDEYSSPSNKALTMSETQHIYVATDVRSILTHLGSWRMRKLAIVERCN